MNKKDKEIFDRIFAHPIVMNIEWNEVEHLFKSLGAEIENTHHSHIKVTLGSHSHSFIKPHHKEISNKQEIIDIRHFLESAGYNNGENKV